MPDGRSTRPRVRTVRIEPLSTSGRPALFVLPQDTMLRGAVREFADTRAGRHTVAALAAALALAVWVGAASLTHRSEPLLVVLVLGPLVASRTGGFRAGLMATILTGAGVLLLGAPPGDAIDSQGEIVALAAMCAVGIVGSWLSDRLRLAAIRAAAEAADAGRRLLRTARDVTDRKNLEEQLRQAQRMEAIGRLAGGVAHDFNNLLTIILGYASQLEYELEDAGPAAPAVGIAVEIRNAAERASRLTQQLLAFSRQQVLQPRVLDLNEAIRGSTGMLQRLAGAGVRLDLALENGLWTVLVDPGQIEQVLMHLIVNGRDAMPRGGSITIRTRTERLVSPRVRQGVSIAAGDWTVLEVTDNGDGMPAAIVSRIFEPFFTTKALGQGTGLGLSTVYGIVKQSGGFIFCDSLPGQGTTMSVYLPRALAAVEGSLQGAGTVAARSGTILVVEDEPAVRSLLCAVLSRAGYRVLEGASAAEALEKLESVSHLDLLVTDVVMPEVNGVELARRVRALRPGTPVLYVSGFADEVLQHVDVVPGAAFVQKPFRPDVLTAKVRDILEGVAAA